MARRITCIYTNSTSPTRYVRSTFKKADQSIGVELTDNPNQAEDFGSREVASGVISKLFNPFNRTYKSKEISVNLPPRISQVIDDLEIDKALKKW